MNDGLWIRNDELGNVNCELCYLINKLGIIMRIVYLLIAVIIFSSCSHTNKLKNYNLDGQTILFEEIIASSAGEASIDFGNTPTASKGDIIGAVKDVALSVGNTLLTYEMERRLRNASRPDSIVKGLSKGFETSMIKFLRIDPVYKLNDRSNFIVTTILERFKMYSTSSGVFIQVSATIEIICRDDGVKIWDYDDTETVRIRRDNYLETTSQQVFLGEISQMIELATLSEEQIRSAIYAAAFQIGRNMSETLRKDIAKLKGR